MKTHTHTHAPGSGYTCPRRRAEPSRQCSPPRPLLLSELPALDGDARCWLAGRSGASLGLGPPNTRMSSCCRKLLLLLPALLIGSCSCGGAELRRMGMRAAHAMAPCLGPMRSERRQLVLGGAGAAAAMAAAAVPPSAASNAAALPADVLKWKSASAVGSTCTAAIARTAFGPKFVNYLARCAHPHALAFVW